MCMGGGGSSAPQKVHDPNDTRYWSPSRRIQDLMARSDSSVAGGVGEKLYKQEKAREDYKANPFLIVLNHGRTMDRGGAYTGTAIRKPAPTEPEVQFRGQGLGIQTPTV